MQVEQDRVGAVLGDQVERLLAVGRRRRRTSMSGSTPSSRTSPSRTLAWSSAITIRSGAAPSEAFIGRVHLFRILVPSSAATIQGVAAAAGCQRAAQQKQAFAHAGQPVSAVDGVHGLRCLGACSSLARAVETVRRTSVSA